MKTTKAFKHRHRTRRAVSAVYTVASRSRELEALLALAAASTDQTARRGLIDATILLAAATIEHAASEYAHVYVPTLYNTRSAPKTGRPPRWTFRVDSGPVKLKKLLGSAKPPYGTVALWKLRSAIMHIEPQRSRTYRWFTTRNKLVVARRAVRTVQRVLESLDRRFPYHKSPPPAGYWARMGPAARAALLAPLPVARRRSAGHATRAPTRRAASWRPTTST